jgi:hypothetical protein
MSPEPISTAYFINPSHQSLCLHDSPLLLLGNGSIKNLYRGNEYTRNNKIILGRVVFYAFRVV